MILSASPSENVSMRKHVSLDYHFNEREVMEMARFLRSMESDIPDALTDFYTVLQRKVYDSLSLGEAEHFYS